ncbi:helix-turn-helix transcriptional regulator [Parvibaculum sp.]|uniref:helix-turn-helix domain-containing protein n=1 Tax=Parvibaculum sp. TaxID=2024848 RepID=UPI0025F8E76A|nr:helix-turn-helix transcriptional regulator [Parvibaculum sp.]
MSRKPPNPVDIHVGGRIRMRRMLIGMSQEKLGESLELTFQQVQKYEKGSNRVGASRLYQIAQVLGVPVSYFYEGLEAASTADEGPDTGFDFELLSTTEGIQLNAAFFSISDPSLRKRLLDLIKLLANREEIDSPLEQASALASD